MSYMRENTVLLDLSAAFDCMGYDILFCRLEKCFGIQGQARQWIQSYLTDHSMQVQYGGKLTRNRPVRCGVLQGSIQGLLFFIYISQLEDMVSGNQLHLHMYADDIQLYRSSDPSDLTNSVKILTNCIADVDRWLGWNRLKLNTSKTKFIVPGYSRQTAKVNIDNLDFGSVHSKRTHAVRDLGVIIDENLTDQISKIVSGSFYQLSTVIDSQKRMQLKHWCMCLSPCILTIAIVC